MISLTHLIQWMCFVVVSFYNQNLVGLGLPHISMPHFDRPQFNKPEINVPQVDLDDEQNQQAMEMGKIAASMTGHETTEEILTVALDYTKTHDGMESATMLIESLLADGLTPEQQQELEKWDKKIDAAIKLSKFAPQAKEQIDNQVKNYTGGQLTIEQLDMLIHVVLGKENPQF